MCALIVYAHPEPTSFTAAMRDTAQLALEDEDVTVQVSDVYADGFEAVAGQHDFTVVEEQERLHYQREQQHVARHNSFAADIAREQERLSAAHLVLFVFPLWWGGVPAILKGWLDLVLAYEPLELTVKRMFQGATVDLASDLAAVDDSAAVEEFARLASGVRPWTGGHA